MASRLPLQNIQVLLELRGEGLADLTALLSLVPIHIVSLESQLPVAFLHLSPKSRMVIGFDCEGVGHCHGHTGLYFLKVCSLCILGQRTCTFACPLYLCMKTMVNGTFVSSIPRKGLDLPTADVKLLRDSGTRCSIPSHGGTKWTEEIIS
ncbi:hypothetical protein Sango_1671700 [Sesamum angolense]|uniref:Uncharacterized protein n=1 Tax=Sesamum angolense TaxID=2727404 RepID=A0AAE1WL70_9LAMI|nr:hypothetical protein Sango_1671700 [Sesamum angolense]